VRIYARTARANVRAAPHIQHRRLNRSSPKLVHTLIGTMGKSYGSRRSRVRIDVCGARANVRAALHIQHRRPNGWSGRAPNWYTHSLGQRYGSRRSRVRIDVCAVRANVRAALHIQHRRPNGWADRGPHWYKHLLGLWAEVMGVGDRECALMRALRAQTCAHHHLSSIGAEGLDRLNPKLVQ
jgi:hypothetical protein